MKHLHVHTVYAIIWTVYGCVVRSGQSPTSLYVTKEEAYLATRRVLHKPGQYGGEEKG